MKKYGNINIFENLHEIVNPEHTALVVWDNQNALVNHIFNHDAYLSNLHTLLAAAHKMKIAIIYTQINPIPAAYQSAWGLTQNMKRFNVDDPTKIPATFKPDSPEAEINEAVAPVEGDLILPKQSPNIFFGTNFEQLMRFRGIDTILFTGIATEYGIDHSARESSVRGFTRLSFLIAFHHRIKRLMRWRSRYCPSCAWYITPKKLYRNGHKRKNNHVNNCDINPFLRDG